MMDLIFVALGVLVGVELVALGSEPLLRGFRLGVRGRLLCYGCAAFLWYVAWRLAGG